MSSSKDLSGGTKPVNIDDKIREIEDRIRLLYEKRIPHYLSSQEKIDPVSQLIKKKLENVSQDIQQFSTDVKNSIGDKITEKTLSDVHSVTGSMMKDGKSAIIERKESIFNTLDDIGQRIENIDNLTEDINTGTKLNDEKDLKSGGTTFQNEDKLHQQLFDSFYNEKSEKPIETKDDVSKEDVSKDSIVKDRLEKIDDQIRQIKEGLTSFYTQQMAVPRVLPQEKTAGVDKISEDKDQAGKMLPRRHGPIMLRPKEKKAGLFNDVNLTEDYELGFRFYQLGFKTGFFNVKIDPQDEASRIAVAEFFPNKFWTSVKQRSRWVAGIVFQNWKAHKWSGNLATKYFLFRDRKSIFSFFSAFLSNILLVYLIVALITRALGYYNIYSLVGHSSVLWYLMIANLIFMISRLSHRFVFTYNWYGFRYAFFSLFRLPLDTFINFFAIARSLSVYKNIKSQRKAVWDSTSHY